MAQAKNSQPLPPPRQTGKPVAGVRLPPDRHCLTQANFALKSPQSMAAPQQRFISSTFHERQQPTSMDQRVHSDVFNRPIHGSAPMQTDYDS